MSHRGTQSPSMRQSRLYAGQRRRRARFRVPNRSVWLVRPTMLAACGPMAAMRTWVPVCDCEPPVSAVPYARVMFAPSLVISVAVRPGGAAGSAIWLLWPGSAGPRTSASGRLRGDGGPDDRAAVAVVGGHKHQRVGVAAGERGARRDRRVEVDRLADLAARVGRVVLLVDARALDLQEEALVRVAVVEQFQGLAGLVGQLRLGLRQRRVGGAARRRRAAVDRRRAGPVHRHVAVGEQAEDRLALLRRRQVRGGVDDVVAGRLRLVQHRLAGELPGRDLLVEVLRAAAEQDVGAGLDELLGDRAGAAVLLGVDRALGGRLDRALAVA